MDMRKDNHVTDQNIAQAVELAPLIERVHGTNHPELTRVRELAAALPDADEHDRAGLFEQLRIVTQDYALPADACEAYTSTYRALERADREHTALVGAPAKGHP